MAGNRKPQISTEINSDYLNHNIYIPFLITNYKFMLPKFCLACSLATAYIGSDSVSNDISSYVNLNDNLELVI